MTWRPILAGVGLLLLAQPGCTTVMAWKHLEQHRRWEVEVIAATSVRAWRESARWTVEVVDTDGEVRTICVPNGPGSGPPVGPPRPVVVEPLERGSHGRIYEVRLLEGDDVCRLDVTRYENEGRQIAPFVAGLAVTPVTFALDLLGLPITFPLGLYLLWRELRRPT